MRVRQNGTNLDAELVNRQIVGRFGVSPNDGYPPGRMRAQIIACSEKSPMRRRNAQSSVRPTQSHSSKTNVDSW